MRFTPRSIASIAAVTVTATSLMLTPTANADAPGEPGPPTTAQGSLHAWRGLPVGAPDRVFKGFECQPTEYRYNSWRVVSDGPPELWMGFKDAECQDASGFFDPSGGVAVRHGVGSVQRFR